MALKPPIGIKCFRTPPGELVGKGSEAIPGRREFPAVTTPEQHFRLMREAGYGDVEWARGMAWMWDGELFVDWVSDLWPDGKHRDMIRAHQRETLKRMS